MRSLPRKVYVILVAAGLVLSAISASAAEPAADKPKPLDGKDLFKTHCKVCHGPKADAGEYTPMTLIQEQWDEFFAGVYTEVHAKVAAPEASAQAKPADTTKLAEHKVTDVIDAAMLEAIRKFCVDHAADSEQPMTCG